MTEQFSDLEPDVIVGSLLSDKYLVIELVGVGGMSVVYKAKDQLLDRLVAIKFLANALDDNSVARFRLEGIATGKLDSPHIINVHELHLVTNEKPYLVMDYVNGHSLYALLRKEGRFSLQEAAHIVEQAAEALEHAHSRGIIHRDVKPSNIIITSTPRNHLFVKIVDFGIAKLKEMEGERQGLTGAGIVLGSPLYMSPEQCAGGEVDARSDIYALGCVFYEMLSGAPPFLGSTAAQTMRKHLEEKPRPLSSLVTTNDMPPAIDRIIMRCLEKDPKMRYQNLRSFSRDLNVAMHPQTSPAKTGLRRWRLPAALGCVGLGLLLIAILNANQEQERQVKIPTAVLGDANNVTIDQGGNADSETLRVHLAQARRDYENQNFGRAEATLQEMLPVGARLYGEDSNSFAALLGPLILYARANRDYNSAMTQARRMQAIYEKTDANSADLGRSIGWQAIISEDWGSPEKAERLYSRSLHLMEESGRPSHWLDENYARLLAEERRFDEAKTLYEQALRLCDEQGNVRAGKRVLRQMIKMYEGEPDEKALAATKDLQAKYLAKWQGLEHSPVNAVSTDSEHD